MWLRRLALFLDGCNGQNPERKQFTQNAMREQAVVGQNKRWTNSPFVDHDETTT